MKTFTLKMAAVKMLAIGVATRNLVKVMTAAKALVSPKTKALLTAMKVTKVTDQQKGDDTVVRIYGKLAGGKTACVTVTLRPVYRITEVKPVVVKPVACPTAKHRTRLQVVRDLVTAVPDYVKFTVALVTLVALCS